MPRGPLPVVRHGDPVPAAPRHRAVRLRASRRRFPRGPGRKGARAAPGARARAGRGRRVPAPAPGREDRRRPPRCAQPRGGAGAHLRDAPAADAPGQPAEAAGPRGREPPLDRPRLRGVPRVPGRGRARRRRAPALHVPAGLPAAVERQVVRHADRAPAARAAGQPRPRPLRGAGRDRLGPAGRDDPRAGGGQPVLPGGARARGGRAQRGRRDAGGARDGPGRPPGADQPPVGGGEVGAPDGRRAGPRGAARSPAGDLDRPGPARAPAPRAHAARVPPRARRPRGARLLLQARPHPRGGVREPDAEPPAGAARGGGGGARAPVRGAPRGDRGPARAPLRAGARGRRRPWPISCAWPSGRRGRTRTSRPPPCCARPCTRRSSCPRRSARGS